VLKGARTRAAAENQTRDEGHWPEASHIRVGFNVGVVVLRMLSNVKQATIAPGIKTRSPGIYTDGYRICLVWVPAQKRVSCQRRVRSLRKMVTVSMRVHVNTSGRFLVSLALVV